MRLLPLSVKATENNTVLNNININKLIVGSATEIKIFPNPAQEYYHCRIPV
ncbi:MAG: hypothetical protein IPO02_13990 [Bacteroidetes bacterium]|nr:hypothetical protein [Bacteroidota bacterium]